MKQRRTRNSTRKSWATTGEKHTPTNLCRHPGSNQGFQGTVPWYRLQRQSKSTRSKQMQHPNSDETVSGADLGGSCKYSIQDTYAHCAQSREQKSVPSQQPVLNRPNYAADAPSRCRPSIPLGATSQKYRVSTLSGPTSRLQPDSPDSMKLSTLPPWRLRPGLGRVMVPRPVSRHGPARPPAESRPQRSRPGPQPRARPPPCPCGARARPSGRGEAQARASPPAAGPRPRARESCARAAADGARRVVVTEGVAEGTQVASPLARPRVGHRMV